MSVRVTGSVDYGRGRVVIVSEHGVGEIAALMFIQAVNRLERDRAARSFVTHVPAEQQS